MKKIKTETKIIIMLNALLVIENLINILLNYAR